MDCRAVLPVRLLVRITTLLGLFLISWNLVPHIASAQEKPPPRSLFYFGDSFARFDHRELFSLNANAAETTNADRLWPGQGGAERTGNGVIVGIWDGGPVLPTHQELLGFRVPGTRTDIGILGKIQRPGANRRFSSVERIELKDQVGTVHDYTLDNLGPNA